MISEIDEAILGSLRKGLADMVHPDNIGSGIGPDKKKSVLVSNTDFTIEESGMSVSEVKNEEKFEIFDADGQSAEFTLTGTPVKEILKVEHPKGHFRTAPDDYTLDKVKNSIVFREAPKKGSDAVLIRYELDKPLGESHILKFALIYSINISAENPSDRDKITIAAIETLYKDVNSLFLQGVEDIKFNRGYTKDSPDGTGKNTVLEYTVMASRRIDVVYPTIGKVEIKRSKI